MPVFHFVVNPHDPNMEWREIIPKFEATKALVVFETGPKSHTHVQMEAPISEKKFDDVRREEITKKHYILRTHPNKRPCKRAKICDAKGYQYVVKQEDSEVLHSVGFTSADLDELKQASDDYVEELKHTGEPEVWAALEKHKCGGFELMKTKAFEAYYEFITAQGKAITPQFKWRCLTIMSRWQDATEGFKQCMSAHLSK